MSQEKAKPAQGNTQQSPSNTDEQVRQEERSRYGQLADIAKKVGDADLAERYYQARIDVGLSKKELEERTMSDVAEIVHSVRLFVQWGQSGVDNYRRTDNGYDDRELYVESGSGDFALLFTTMYPELAESVLPQAYHQLGLTELRAQTQPEVSNDAVGCHTDTYMMLTPWGVQFNEERVTTDQSTTYMLSVSQIDSPQTAG